MNWRPEAQRDPYAWLAALGGHMSIGVALWIAFAWLGPWQAVCAAAALYAAWEGASARRYGLLLFDSLLDWCAATFGARTAMALWQQDMQAAIWSCAAALIVAAAGAAKRRN